MTQWLKALDTKSNVLNSVLMTHGGGGVENAFTRSVC